MHMVVSKLSHELVQTTEEHNVIRLRVYSFSNCQEECINLPNMRALPWWQRRLHAVATKDNFEGDLEYSTKLVVSSHLQIIHWNY